MTSPITNAPRSPADRRYRLFMVGGIAIAIVAFVLAIWRTNTDDAVPADVASQPDVVERLIPPQDTEHLRQSEIGIDLGPGYQAILFVNGVEIPAGQTRVVDAENQYFFAPGEDTVIEELGAGRTCADALVWKSEDGRGAKDQRFHWCFDVL
jgi:hypothetical protein